jgi:hypothetical protein
MAKTVKANAYTVIYWPDQNRVTVGQWTSHIDMIEADTKLNQIFEVGQGDGKPNTIEVNVLALDKGAAGRLGIDLIILDSMRQALLNLPTKEQQVFTDLTLNLLGQKNDEDWVDIIYGV